MTKFKLSSFLLAVSTVLSSQAAFANEQAQDLVGKFYAGGHLMHIKTDNERLMSSDLRSDVDHGTGFGLEAGYRFTEEVEFRLAHSEINLVKQRGGYSEPDASATAFDVLYFLNKESFYLLGGINSMDIVDRKTSVDLGAGYRHYLNERTALYFEGKSHYQFSEHFTDYSAQLGFVYFFGDMAKPVAAPKQATKIVAAKASQQVLDSDNDGVADKNDQCANTPAADQVDAKGCTIFDEEKLRVELLVNFDNNKAVVKPEYFAEVQDMANFMRTYPHTNLVIEGHTSALGNSEHNKKLSQARAKAIATMLIKKHGIKAERIATKGYGEERLINQNNTAQAHKENRRIEAVIEVTKKIAKKH